MSEPLRKAEEFPQTSHEARGDAAKHERESPIGTTTQRTEREPEATLGGEIRARIVRAHKGDVGRPGTNEEVFQGSKGRELK